MRAILLLLGLGLLASAAAQEPTDPAPSTPVVAPPDAHLERHFPASQQRRLGEGSDSFLALWLPAAQPQARGAVLLVGDRGEHADWPELIGPARRQLSEAGWHTLAMAIPPEPPPAFGLDEQTLTQRHADQRAALVRRLELGLGALREGQDAALPTTIIARGAAGYWALVVASDDPQIAGLALFEVRAPAQAEPALEQLIGSWDRPLLELIQGDPGPLAGHPERAATARRLDRPDYQQWRLAPLRTAPQTQKMLIRRLQGWLERLPER